MHHVLVFNSRLAKKRSLILWHGRGQLRAMKKLWNWNISRFSPLFFYLYLFFFSTALLCQLSLLAFPQSSSDCLFFSPFFDFFLFCAPAVSTLSSLITLGMIGHEMNFGQVWALLTLTQFSNVCSVITYFLANVQYVGVQPKQEAMNVGVAVSSEGNTRGQIL